MAGAFLADTLREQARAELQGKMLQDQIAGQVARQIIGQISQQEIGRSVQGIQGRGRALQSAADQTSRREVITAAASATGALGAHFAMQPGYEGPEFEAPDTELEIPDEDAFREKLVNPDVQGLNPDFGNTTLDVSMPSYEGITTDLAPTPDTQLEFGGLGSTRTVEDLLNELKRQDPRDPLGVSGYTGVSPGTPLSDQIRSADAYRGKTLKF